MKNRESGLVSLPPGVRSDGMDVGSTGAVSGDKYINKPAAGAMARLTHFVRQLTSAPILLSRSLSPVCFLSARSRSSTRPVVTMVKAQVYYMAKAFKEEPKVTDFEIKEEELPALKDGEILAEAVYLSVDPYMRAYMQSYPAGSKMIGGQVAKVVESKNKDFAVGDYIIGYLGWTSRSVVNPELSPLTMGQKVQKVRYPDVALSLNLGVIGMPGQTAYFGLLELCKPKAGETVVVSGAAGAVGSIVGQIAKIKGCTVIGFAGSDDKVSWLKDTLKFDHAFNYKKTDVRAALKQAAPKGVDCYFDNVGGSFSSAVLAQMNTFGRIAVCGAISAYNDDMANNPPLAPIVQGAMVFKQLKMEGFLVTRWMDRFDEATDQLYAWLKEGKLVVSEKVYHGFENMPQAFIGLLRGENSGKAVVKV